MALKNTSVNLDEELIKKMKKKCGNVSRAIKYAYEQGAFDSELKPSTLSQKHLNEIADFKKRRRNLISAIEEMEIKIPEHRKEIGKIEDEILDRAEKLGLYDENRIIPTDIAVEKCRDIIREFAHKGNERAKELKERLEEREREEKK